MENKLLKSIIYLTGVSLVLTLSACVVSSRNKLPKNLKTKQEIYNEHFKKGSAGQRYRQRGLRVYQEDDSRVGFSFVRHSKNETQNLFKRLPNPDLVMYVFPHVKGREQTPVPGYTTLFPMYTQVHYAMPGEAPVNTPIMKINPIQRADMKSNQNYNRRHPKRREGDIIKALYQ